MWHHLYNNLAMHSYLTTQDSIKTGNSPNEALLFIPLSDKNLVYYGKMLSFNTDYDRLDYPKKDFFSKAFKIIESLTIFEKGILSLIVFIMFNLQVYLNSNMLQDIIFTGKDKKLADAKIYEDKTTRAKEKLNFFSSKFKNTKTNEAFEPTLSSFIRYIQKIVIFQSEYFGKPPSFELDLDDIYDDRFVHLEDNCAKLTELLTLFVEMLEIITRCSTYEGCFDGEC